jgi:hypothetical protein
MTNVTPIFSQVEPGDLNAASSSVTKSAAQRLHLFSRSALSITLPRLITVKGFPMSGFHGGGAFRSMHAMAFSRGLLKVFWDFMVGCAVLSAGAITITYTYHEQQRPAFDRDGSA